MIVRHSPVDRQITAIESDLAGSWGEASARGRRYGSTSSRSAGPRDPHASLPNAHAQSAGFDDVDEFHIGSFREQSVALYLRADFRDRSSICIVHEHDTVRIANRYRRRIKVEA